MAESNMKQNGAESNAPVRSRRFAWRAIAASAAIVGAMFLVPTCQGMWDKLKSKPETITKQVPKTVEVCSKPVKGDGKCEVDKGEHDPWLPQFDPESCGFCGDAKITPPETADTCFVDAMCGDNEKDRAVYNAIVKLVDGKYGLDKVVVDECDMYNKFYCPKDCPPEEPKKVVTSGRRRTEQRTGPAAPQQQSADCTGQNADALKSAIRRRIDGKSEEIRNAFANSDAARVTVEASASFNSSENPIGDLLNASVTCAGSQDQCKSPEGSATGILNFKLEGYKMVGAGKCTLRVSRPASAKY